MFFRKKAFQDRSYLQIVENNRNGNKVTQRVIATIGRIDELESSGKLASLLASGAKFTHQAMILSAFRKGEAPIASTKRIGPPIIFERLWSETGCRQVISELIAERDFQFPLERAVFTTVLHRLLDPGSDRQAHLWKEDYQIDGADPIQLHHFYRAMEWLGTETSESGRTTKDIIEERLFGRKADLFSALDLVFFDTTSIYFEGHGGETIGQYGHSKDHRPDLKQMVVGAVLDSSGKPICCEILPGNTTDVKALIPVAQRLKQRFGISRVCIVADRGMISAETIAELEKMEWNYILGAKMRKINELKNADWSDPDEFEIVRPWKLKRGDPSPLEVKELKINGTRYVVCYNEEEALKEHADREAIISALKEQLRQGAKSLVGNKGYRRYLKSLGKGFELDESKAIEEARYDGIYILRTNTDLGNADVALKYKQLWMVEDLFRKMKSVLSTRPVYHKMDETIRGHVFCSFLALLLLKELMSRLSKQGISAEWRQVLHDLDILQEVTVEQDGHRIRIRTQTSGLAGKTFQAVGVALPPVIRQVD